MSATSKNKVVTASFSRPANTTAYADGDAVSDDATTPTIITLSKAANRRGGGGLIRGLTLHKSDQDTTNADFDVYIFDTAPTAAGFDDNSAIAITDAEWQACIGFVSFANGDARSVVTGDLWCKTVLDMPFQCAAGSRDLYAVIVARAAYTPASGETFQLRLLATAD